MCVTSQGKVIKIEGNKAIVEINDKIEEVRVDLLDVKIGDRVYCTSGMAVEKVE